MFAADLAADLLCTSPWCAVAAVAAIAIVRRKLLVDVPTLHYQNVCVKDLLAQLPTLRRGYSPPLLPFGLLQSAYADRKPPVDPTALYVRETLSIPRLGASTTKCCPASVPPGVVSIDWLQQPGNAPVCILVPGLTSASTAPYIQRVGQALHAAGVRVGCFNPRGRGGNELLTPFMYSAGFTEDLRHVAAHVRERYPEATVTAVGFSLGASYLAKYVGEEGTGCALDSAVSCACPLDLVSMSQGLGATVSSRFVDRFVLVPAVKRVLHQCAPQVRSAPALDFQRATVASSMAEFDDAMIAPMMGCSSALQYYSEASATRVLGDVRVPMLFLSARNDPICPANRIDTKAFTEQQTPGAAPIVLAITAEGAHSMTWPEGWGLQRSWLCELLVEWVRAVDAKRT
jgi:abhydrolase domain-containing protein 1/3